MPSSHSRCRRSAAASSQSKRPSSQSPAERGLPRSAVNVKLALTIDMSRALAERLTAQAIRGGQEPGGARGRDSRNHGEGLMVSPIWRDEFGRRRPTRPCPRCGTVIPPRCACVSRTCAASAGRPTCRRNTSSGAATARKSSPSRSVTAGVSSCRCSVKRADDGRTGRLGGSPGACAHHPHPRPARWWRTLNCGE